MSKYKNFGKLIKWPQCVICGDKITVDQAKLVLSKVDDFFLGFGSNHTEYDNKLWTKLGMFKTESYVTKDDHGNEVIHTYTSPHNVREDILHLSYLTTDYLSSCYINGVCGWCHPNGTIFSNRNIGKWPEWDDIEEDLTMIAKAFPFIKMKVWLFNQEHHSEEYYEYEKKCVGGFDVEHGNVRELDKKEFLSPNDEKVTKELLYYSDEFYDEMIKEKREIFGNNADIDIMKKTNSEVFFTENEFIEYFKDVIPILKNSDDEKVH